MMRCSFYLLPAVTFCLMAMPLRAAAPASTPATIAVVLDGKPIDFYSQIMSERIPAKLVEGHAMLPVRFFDEVLHLHLDLHLDHWGIVQLDDPANRRLGNVYAFKLGDKRVSYPVAMIGGDLSSGFELPIAPMIINNRYYIPARPFLGEFGYDVAWDAQGKVLTITRQPANKP